jgi:hypothetical protein
MVDVEHLTGVPGGRGTLASLSRPNGSPLLFSRKLFANKRSNLQVFESDAAHTDPVRAVVKRVGETARIREEHAAIELLRRHPEITGFVPTAPLYNHTGHFFSHAGHAYFAMPLVGRDMVDYRADHADSVDFSLWAETAVSTLSVVAATLLTLWQEAGSSYYDVKSRNILAVRDLVDLEPPFSQHEVLLCDTGSINSPCATHHPPVTLTQHAPNGSRTRYRLYIAWGMICTLIEMLEGPDEPRALRAMRHLTTERPIQVLDAAIDRLLVSVKHDPEAYVRVLSFLRVARDGVETGQVEDLLSRLAAC